MNTFCFAPKSRKVDKMKDFDCVYYLVPKFGCKTVLAYCHQMVWVFNFKNCSQASFGKILVFLTL